MKYPRFRNLRSFGTIYLYIRVTWVSHISIYLTGFFYFKRLVCTFTTISVTSIGHIIFLRIPSVKAIKPKRISVIVNNSAAFLIGISKSILII